NKIRVLISDGKSCVSNCMFVSPHLDRAFHQGKLAKFTVVSLDKYDCAALPQTPDNLVLIVKEISLLKPGSQLNRKLEAAEKFSVCTESLIEKPSFSFDQLVRSRPQTIPKRINNGSVMGRI